jgi:hypothetical protein
MEQIMNKLIAAKTLTVVTLSILPFAAAMAETTKLQDRVGGHPGQELGGKITHGTAQAIDKGLDKGHIGGPGEQFVDKLGGDGGSRPATGAPASYGSQAN